MRPAALLFVALVLAAPRPALAENGYAILTLTYQGAAARVFDEARDVGSVNHAPRLGFTVYGGDWFMKLRLSPISRATGDARFASIGGGEVGVHLPGTDGNLAVGLAVDAKRVGLEDRSGLDGGVTVHYAFPAFGFLRFDPSVAAGASALFAEPRSSGVWAHAELELIAKIASSVSLVAAGGVDPQALRRGRRGLRRPNHPLRRGRRRPRSLRDRPECPVGCSSSRCSSPRPARTPSAAACRRSTATRSRSCSSSRRAARSPARSPATRRAPSSWRSTATPRSTRCSSRAASRRSSAWPATSRSSRTGRPCRRRSRRTASTTTGRSPRRRRSPCASPSTAAGSSSPPRFQSRDRRWSARSRSPPVDDGWLAPVHRRRRPERLVHAPARRDPRPLPRDDEHDRPRARRTTAIRPARSGSSRTPAASRSSGSTGPSSSSRAAHPSARSSSRTSRRPSAAPRASASC